jgi:hypothetical protein
MFEEKPQTLKQKIVAEKTDAHDDALFRAWCRAIGLSQDEIARIVNETTTEEPARSRRDGRINARR